MENQEEECRAEKAEKARASRFKKDDDTNTTSNETHHFDPKEKVNDWLDELDNGDMKMFAMTLYYHFWNNGKESVHRASAKVSKIIGKDERTIRAWKAQFEKEEGIFPETTRGKYVRDSLINDERFKLKATKWVREHAFVKGQPNMTGADFQNYINGTLLPEMHVGDTIPQICTSTARAWLHKLGFEPVDKSNKCVYIDGHEREDVVAYRAVFLQNMLDDEESHLPPPKPSDEQITPEEEAFTQQRMQAGCKKLVIICHDESTFNANDDQTAGWADETMSVIKPKSRGSGLMVSDFVEEYGGFLELTPEEYAAAKAAGHKIKSPKARKLLEYGENRDGYWKSERFLEQMENALDIAELKYPKDEYDLLWILINPVGTQKWPKMPLMSTNLIRNQVGSSL